MLKSIKCNSHISYINCDLCIALFENIYVDIKSQMYVSSSRVSTMLKALTHQLDCSVLKGKLIRTFCHGFFFHRPDSQLVVRHLLLQVFDVLLVA